MHNAAILALGAIAVVAAQEFSIPANWTAVVEPFRVAENIYYVGTEDLASYLVTTPEGHFLIDSGVEQNAEPILNGIRTLGFDVKQVRMLLTTQAHYDHVAAHARLKTASGARVLASKPDAAIMEGGGKGDYHFGPRFYFPPVKVDRIVRDGETVRLGGTALTAVMTPGHTQGTTTWTMHIGGPAGRLVVFAGSTAVNEGVRLVDNAAYPSIADDLARSFQVLEALQPDVFLAAHASAVGGISKVGKAGRSEYTAYLARSRDAFERELAKQRAESSRKQPSIRPKR